MIDKLKIRVHILVNGCSMCFANVETSNHLLIHYCFWHREFGLLSFQDLEWIWVMPVNLKRKKVIQDKSGKMTDEKEDGDGGL